MVADWLQLGIHCWPKPSHLPPNQSSDEAEELCSHIVIISDPIVPCDRFSSFTRLVRVTAWVKRFLYNCLAKKEGSLLNTSPLTVDELDEAQNYWLSQIACFSSDIETLRKKTSLPRSSSLLTLRPFLDEWSPGELTNEV